MARQPASTPMRDSIDQGVSRLRELVLAAMKQWDVEAVHHARVATRRLKAAMDLVGRAQPGERLSADILEAMGRSPS